MLKAEGPLSARRGYELLSATGRRSMGSECAPGLREAQPDSASTGRSIAATAGAAVCLAAAIVIGAGTAQAAVFCGKSITRDTTLKANLKNCPGEGLVIDAGDITLNLNGHKIDGENAVASAGVRVFGHAGVTIKGGAGGRISEYETG